jgi:Ni2+-binding GTPase involved in maturation of urease and hydrogenase
MPTTDHRRAAGVGRLRPGGFLITMDGPSGVGKTTVTALICQRLMDRGISVVATRQPSDTAMGRLARASTHEPPGGVPRRRRCGNRRTVRRP